MLGGKSAGGVQLKTKIRRLNLLGPSEEKCIRWITSARAVENRSENWKFEMNRLER